MSLIEIMITCFILSISFAVISSQVDTQVGDINKMKINIGEIYQDGA